MTPEATQHLGVVVRLWASSTSMGSGVYGSDFVAGGIGKSHCDTPCCCCDRALANMTSKVRLHISCITKSTSIVFGPSRAYQFDVILAGAQSVRLRVRFDNWRVDGWLRVWSFRPSWPTRLRYPKGGLWTSVFKTFMRGLIMVIF